MNKETYLACRKIIKNFIKKGYWTSFSSADLFYIVEGRHQGLFTFVEQFFGDSFGCQLFFTTAGFNYVHDILTTKSENVVSLSDCDSLCAILISKEELKEDEIAFLRKNKLRVMENHNLILYRFQPGSVQKFASDKEIQIFMEYLEYISSILTNEFDDVVEAFKETKTVVAMMDTTAMEYAILYRPLPYLERMPRRLKANLDFVEDFKNCVYINDECYCFASYLPVIIQETGIRPMVIYFSFPKLKKHYFKYIMTHPKEYKNVIFGILYDVFTEIGVPYKMLFNHREIYALLEKTIELMHIEHGFLREETTVDSDINDLISRIYNQSQNEYIEQEDFIKLLMDTITTTLNDLDLYEDEDFEEEEVEEFVS